MNQQLAGSSFKKPEDLVRYMGAIQAQVYQMSKWAVGLRLESSFDEEVESAFNSGKIIRTHILRPTWHLVHPEDLRWMLKLSAPRVQSFNAYMYRQQELDEKLLRKTGIMICKMLEGRKFKTRAEVKEMLNTKGIKTDTVRLSCIMMHAELEGLICSGPRNGKQFTYALFEERIQTSRHLEKDESLASIAETYFRSRGPSSAKDLIWWSGLTAKDVKRAINMLIPKLKMAQIDNCEMYFFEPGESAICGKGHHTILMPEYDEYAASYSNRQAMYSRTLLEKANSNRMNDFSRQIIHKGMSVGRWDPTQGKNKMPMIELNSDAGGISVKRTVKRCLEFQKQT